jgi:COP9 signalosome complex subunit 4
VLQKASLEHNIQVLSKVYLNISFEQMGSLLAIDAMQAESILSAMASEGRIKATLDQLEGTVEFLPKTKAEEVAVFGGENEE